MKTLNVSSKEVRKDLKGFFDKLKQGEVINVVHRSRHLVTIAAVKERDPYLNEDAGTPAAARRTAAFARKLPKRKMMLDPHKSIKQLYEETKQL